MNTGQQQFSVHPEEFGASGHECEHCFNGPEATPMTSAFVAMSVAPHERYKMLNAKIWVKADDGETQESLFMMGWMVGVEGNLDEDTPMDAKLFGHNRTVWAYNIRAWMVGFVAGRYAHQHGWQSASCKLGDPLEHATETPLDRYIKDVREAGAFPASFIEDPSIRGLIGTCFDAGSQPRVAAKVVAKAIELNVARLHVEGINYAPEIIVGSDRDEAYFHYAQILDKEAPGWHWTDLAWMAAGLAKHANQRRLRSTGEHGYKSNPDRLTGCEINEHGLVITWIPRQG